MAELQLPLSAEEHQYLVELLEEKLKETEIEEHRTDSPRYREKVVVRQERVIESLLNKLRQQPGAPAAGMGAQTSRR
jgi:hypothetical protein